MALYLLRESIPETNTSVKRAVLNLGKLGNLDSEPNCVTIPESNFRSICFEE